MNRPDDQPTHLSRAWKTLSTPDLAIASEDIQKICDREFYTQLGGSDHLPVLLKVTLTEQTTSQKKEPNWNYTKADWSKFQKLTDMLCRELDTDNSKNINASVHQLTAYFKQQGRPSTEAEGRTTSLTGVTTCSAFMTYSQKPESDLNSTHRQSTPSSTIRQGLLLMKKRSRKPASHGKKRLPHSTWRKTHRSSGIRQRP